METTHYESNITIKSSSKNLAQSFSEVILSSLPHGITILDTKGKIIFANESAKKILHTVRFPSKTKHIVNQYEIYDDKGNKLSQNDLPSQQSLLKKKPQERLLRFWHKEIGIETWSLVKSQPLFENGQMIGVVNVFHDMTSLKKSQSRIAFLNTLSEKLTSSLNYDIRLRKLAEQIVPTVADWCAIDMISDNNELKRVVIQHKEQKKINLAKKIQEQFPADPKSTTGSYGVLKSGKIEFHPTVTEGMINTSVKNMKLRKMLLQIGLSSIVILPLIARNRKLGVITFAHSESRRQFVQDDLGFLKNIASKAALLCDNGRMYATVVQSLKDKQKTEADLRESRNTLSLALDASNMGIWDWDIKTNKLLWSHQLEAIHKLKPKSFKGTYAHFLSLIHPEDRGKFEKDIDNAFTSTKGFETEYRLKVSESHKKDPWIYGAGEVLLDEHGKPTRMIGIGMEITDRKNHEIDILERENKFRSIFNAVTEAMFITDEEGLILETNRSVETLFGEIKNEIITKRFRQHLDEKSQSDFLNSWKEMKRNGKAQCEISITSRDGQKRTFDTLFLRHVVSSKHLVVLSDITEHKHEAKRREHFLSIASHELRSPLANLKVYLELLKKEYKQTNGKALEYILKSEQKVDMVTKLISDLLDVTRIREGKLELYFELVDAASYIKNVVKDLQLVVNDHTIITTQLAHGTITIDKTRITQVITNLVTNAAKYSKENSTISIHSYIKNGWLYISVTDTGTGIAKKDFQNLFTIYNQGNSANKSGLGLGLYISKQIITQHDGDMTVKSNVGKGSTFTFSLPLNKS